MQPPWRQARAPESPECRPAPPRFQRPTFSPQEDPLLELVRAYRAARADYRANAPKGDDELGDASMDERVDSHFFAIVDVKGPARTREGAMEALRLAAEEGPEASVTPITQPLMLAALAYLEGAQS